MMMRLLLSLGFLWCGAFALPGCGQDDEGNSPAANDETVDIFTEESLARGINFVHSTGATGRRYMPEMLGSGGALFDCDGDGDLDLLLINGGRLPGSSSSALNALFINDGTGHFARAKNANGLSGTNDYGVGCATADVDGDGDIDVFCSNWGPDRLYINDGTGNFTEDSLKRGIIGSSWGASAAFGDLNGDGLVDLYVSNYVLYDINKHKPCHQGIHEVYCGPQPFDGAPDNLYINQGGGRFKDVTKNNISPIPDGRGLGVAMVDFDHDQDLDIYVANDETPNFLLENDGEGNFTDIALIAGVALSHDAAPEAGMGVAFADFDNDMFEDIIVTNFEDQVNSVYRNTGDGLFDEISFEVGVGYDSRPFLGWGVSFVDINMDGYKDVFYANGHIYDNAHLLNDNTTWEQPNRLQLNRRNGTFAPAEESDCAALQTQKVSRAAIFGDIDNDGDVDIVVTAIDDAPELLINNTNGKHWLFVAALSKSGSPVQGTRVVLETAGMKQVGSTGGGYSYLAQNDSWIHFGLGNESRVVKATAYWPGGGTSVASDVSANGLLVFQRGEPARLHTNLADGSIAR